MTRLTHIPPLVASAPTEAANPITVNTLLKNNVGGGKLLIISRLRLFNSISPHHISRTLFNKGAAFFVSTNKS
jgi:hypothetical protein